jgi:hypothetical protein
MDHTSSDEADRKERCDSPPQHGWSNAVQFFGPFFASLTSLPRASGGDAHMSGILSASVRLPLNMGDIGESGPGRSANLA